MSGAATESKQTVESGDDAPQKDSGYGLIALIRSIRRTLLDLSHGRLEPS
jgi:hypothetical protein